MAKIYATPGVYIEEKSAFPNSAVPVSTAVPAFIGYTEKAVRGKKNLTNIPTRISSYGEFLLHFGEGPKTTYSLKKTGTGSFELSPKSQLFFLHHCMKMFFANGGSDCYVVSVGGYEATIRIEDFRSEGQGDASPKGISCLLKEPEPTMVIIPDAVLLPESDCFTLQKLMLQHCGTEMRNRIAILDIFDGFKKRTNDKHDLVHKFRNNIGSEGLSYGAAYYPWLHTTVTGADLVDLGNLSSEDDSHQVLQQLLLEDLAKDQKQGSISDEKAQAIESEIKKIEKGGAGDDINTLHQTLLLVSPLYKEIMKELRGAINLLPPSGAMAGIYAMVDNSVGVHQSPANVSVGSVVKPAVDISNNEQEDLNVPLDGKAVNAIRTFPGKGVLVWGARTLDGNSMDWRYISVRRTVIFIEQSIKYAIEPYVFEPNVAATWSNVKALVSNFLTNVWSSGALAGATADEAFSVDVGLGTTMTPVDILDDLMRVTVKIAVTRPAEFIVLTFQQQMQKS